MAGMDYDITDPGTRGLMMLQAFNARMAGRDGLMEAYKLGEIEREKRKQAAVQQHSMGLLSGMLSGSDPRQLFAQFPLADPGTMSNLVASKVAEDRAARERAAQEQMTIRAEQRAAEDDRKKAQAATIAGDTYLRLSKGATKQLGPLEATPSTGPMRQESNVPEPPPAPEFQNPIEQMLRSPIGGVAAQGNAPFNFQPQPGMAVEQVIPPLPPEQITAEAIKAQNPGIDERGIQPGIDAAQKRIEFMRKQEGDDTLEAASIILDNGPDNYELSMGLIRERGLNVNPTKLKAVLSTSPEWVKATSQAGAEGRYEGTKKLIWDYSEDGTLRWQSEYDPDTGAKTPVTKPSKIPKTVPGAVAADRYRLDQDQVEALNSAVEDGRLNPYRINSRTAKIFADMELKNPGATDYNSLAAEAIYQTSVPVSNTKAMLNSIDPLLDSLIEAGSDLGNSAFPLLNRGINWVKEQTGDPKIVAFNNLRDDTVAEIERGLLGTGVLSDTKYLRAIRNINSAQTFSQLKAAVDNTRIVIKARLEAVYAGPTGKGGGRPPAPGGDNLTSDEQETLRRLRGGK